MKKISIPIKMAKDILRYIQIPQGVKEERRCRDIENNLMRKIKLYDRISELEQEFEGTIE